MLPPGLHWWRPSAPRVPLPAPIDAKNAPSRPTARSARADGAATFTAERASPPFRRRTEPAARLRPRAGRLPGLADRADRSWRAGLAPAPDLQERRASGPGSALDESPSQQSDGDAAAARDGLQPAGQRQAQRG